MKKNTVMRAALRCTLAGALLASLSGCIEMAVGTAVVGTLAATDRRTFGAQTEDKTITVKGETRAANAAYGDAHINVTSFNRKVLLTGEVKDAATKAQVERDIASIEGVLSVSNELEIGSPATYTSRSNDALITTKVKASFASEKNLSSNAIKVLTENNVVFLMGRVTPAEGKLAGEITAGVSGVKRVVKVFEYITEEELARITKG